MLEALRHLVLVAEHGSFTRAAEAASITQPALTSSIKRLEEQLDVRLLERGRFGARLTQSGETLLPHARAATVAVAEGIRAIRQLVDLQSGRVTVGGGATACTYHLPAVLMRFRKRHPDVSLVLRELPEGQVSAALDRGELDIAVVGGDRGELFRHEDAVLVKAPGADARDLPFVTMPLGTATRAMLDRHFPGASIAMEISSVSTIKGTVRAGLGVALLSRSAVATDVQLGRLELVPDARTPIPRPLRILHRGLDRLSPAARALRALLLADAPREKRRRAASRGA